MNDEVLYVHNHNM